MQTTVNKRVFLHNGARLTDPDTAMSPAAVKDFFSAMYPELTNAEIQGPEVTGNDLVYSFHRTTGTKGSTASHRVRPNKQAHSEVTAFVRRLEIAAGETTPPTAAVHASKLNTWRLMMQPITGSPSLTLPSTSFALLL